MIDLNLFGELYLGIISAVASGGLPFLVDQTTNIFKNWNDNQTTINQNDVIKSMLIIVLVMFIIGAISVICAFFSKIFLSKLSARKISEIRLEIFSKIQNAAAADLSNYNHGALLTRLTTDSYNFSLYYFYKLINVIPSALRLIVFALMSIALNWIMGLILLGLSFILYLSSFLMSKNSVKYFEKSLKEIDHLNLISKENIAGSKIIRAFNLKNHQIERFATVNNNIKTYGTKAEIKALISWPFAISFVNASAVLFVLISALVQWSGNNWTTIDIGTIYAIFGYSYLILWSTYDLVFLYVYDVRSLISRHRIYQIQHLENATLNEGDKQFIKGVIEFDNVCFKYQNNSQDYVLNHLNLKINANAKIGIIGPTGSGKTTLLNLLTKFIQPSSGQIKINQTDIKEINTKLLLKNIAYGFQKPHLFSDTLANNLKVANEDLTEAEIQNLIKLVQLDKFVNSKAEKINFMIEEQGNNLSGGQKQRVNIARALARQANIYIFDDTLSALDNITEQKVLKAIVDQTKDDCLLISSQKISTVKNMEQIIVLDQGQISGIGTHEELLNSNFIYQEINRLQNQGGDHE